MIAVVNPFALKSGGFPKMFLGASHQPIDLAVSKPLVLCLPKRHAFAAFIRSPEPKLGLKRSQQQPSSLNSRVNGVTVAHTLVRVDLGGQR